MRIAPTPEVDQIWTDRRRKPWAYYRVRKVDSYCVELVTSIPATGEYRKKGRVIRALPSDFRTGVYDYSGRMAKDGEA